ncbi:hypothetical protein M8C21_019278 [Ambrosia artemisiifolia]|uniref:Senescence regulator S40 n=1 Tax=Ambrosia artemisiifolia TaxID=4212 RepID=A0AAD5DB43_AMBAR|nr:hypothetical protein M8C21_019278 [Ambrosia artemisiifolia]
MAASRTYVGRDNHRHRYFSGENDAPPATNYIFEFTELDVWNVSPSPELQKTVTPPRISNKPLPVQATVNRREVTAPVDVPDWSMILKEEINRTAGSQGNDIDGDLYSGSGDLIPPHEYLARGRIASFSVQEGFGRTLKGRDLSRVRNAVWKKIGFED